MKHKNILFRVDASSVMGNGHLMRCLTLADELSKAKANISFITRLHQGHLNQLIIDKGYNVYPLSPPLKNNRSLDTYKQWLGVEQHTDAFETIEIIQQRSIDWLIVDHYSLDHIWHKALMPYAKKIMVIDDLANRDYRCHLLLDMTTGRQKSNYKALIEPHTQLLLGSDYALLRPQFQAYRKKSLMRQQQSHGVKKILLTMGGSDPTNSTEWVLKCIETSKIKAEISAILGNNAPYLEHVKTQIQCMKMPVTLHCQINNMAELMSSADLAIGTTGTTSWERCCLALPCIAIVTEDNQLTIAKALADLNCLINLGDFNTLKTSQLVQALHAMSDDKTRIKMSLQASKLCDGLGVQRVVQAMLHAH